MEPNSLGDRLVDVDEAKPSTMRDVAEMAEAPLSAVSLVLNGKAGVSDGRRQRILDAVETLQYAPRRRPRTTTRRQPTIGLIMEALSPAAAQDGFMADVVYGVEVGLRDRGMQMALRLYRAGDNPLVDLAQMTGRSVDGVIFANGGDVDRTVIEHVLSSRVPVVMLENYLEATWDTHAVVADNFGAGYHCTQHLLSLGHRRIGMLVGSTRYISLADRRRGYQVALLEAGLMPEAALMPAQAPGDAHKGYHQMEQLLDLAEPPTAVYAVSDKSAIGAYQAIVQRGLRIPEDISIVGTDDVQTSALLDPPLTTFKVPTFELGRTAAQTMHALVEHRSIAPARTVLHGRLVPRTSTRALV